MQKLRVSYAAVKDDFSQAGAVIGLSAYTGEYDLHADALGVHVKARWKQATRLYPWHSVVSMAYEPEPLSDVSLHDLETYCKHGQHVSRRYCGALA